MENSSVQKSIANSRETKCSGAEYFRNCDSGQSSAPCLPPWGYVKSLELNWEFSALFLVAQTILTVPRSGTGMVYF